MSTDLPPPRGAKPPPFPPATFDDSLLRALVGRTRGWLRIAGLGRMLVWLALAVCLAMAIDLATSLSPGVRTILSAVILTGVIFLGIWYLRRKPGEIDTATATRQVEAAHPEIGQLLRTARDASLPNAPVSPAFKAELFRRASVKLATLDLESHLPRKPGKRWLTAGIAALVAFFVFLIANREAPTAFARLVAPFASITYTKVTNVTRDPTFDRNRLPRVEVKVSGRYAKDVTAHIPNSDGGESVFPMNPLGGGRYEVTLPASESSFPFRIEAGDSVPVTGTMECVDPAVFVSSSAEIVFPDYIGQPVAKLDSADVEAVEGSRATLRFKMSGPMAAAALRLPDATVVPLAIAGDEMSATIEMKPGGDMAELTGTDARGHRIESTQFKHKGLVDRLPVVEWIEPTKDLSATAVGEIPLRLRFRDDFGIASYGVVLQVQNETKEILTRRIEAKDLRDLSEMTAAALETFPLTIRDNVRLYAWATDHKPRENVRSVSPLRSVDIKPFKEKWRMGTAPDGPMISGEDLEKVDGLVKTQREILSDAFAAMEGNAKVADETHKELAERETALQQRASVIHREVKALGAWPVDDLNLLAAAISQMGESADAWFAKRTRMGFDRGDAALSTLLELRKNLLIILIKSKQLGTGPGDPPEQLEDLAAEAERLAKEERDVNQQLETQPDENRLEAIRRQQNVANSDTGELFAKLMDHPESTPLILSRMADAEKQVRDATKATTSPNATTTAPPALASAANLFDELAQHLRALNESLLDETLAQMAKDAKKAADAAKKEGEGETPEEESGDQEGAKSADQPGKKPGEKGNGQSPGEGENQSQAQNGKGQQGQGQQGQGQGQGDGEGKEPADLAAKEGKEGATNLTPGNDKEKPGAKAGDPNAGTHLSPGEKVAASPDHGPSATPGRDEPKDAEAQRKEALEKAARQAATNDDVLKFFSDKSSDSAQAKRFESLREQAATEGLEKKLRDAAEGKNDGEQAAAQLRALAQALEQERELRRQSRLESLTKSREKAAELKKQAEERRDAKREATGQPTEKNPGDSPAGEAGNHSAQARENPQGKAGKGKGRGDSPSPGKGGGGGGNNGSGNENDTPLGLARELDRLKDEELSRIARELEKSTPATDPIKPLGDAERRLAALIAEISGLTRDDDSGSSIPPAYRRAVEDYYRALSDDFGDEQTPAR
ncbi:MAG TPA: hypothetical protein VIM57_11340 [Luteolibacter sp.]